MHRDESGRLHLSIAFVGAWSAALGRTMDHVYRILPVAVPRSHMRRVVHGNGWFQHFQCLLPERPDRRPEPVQLHVSSMTGTMVAPDTERFLLERADGVVFVADTARIRIEAALEHCAELDRVLVPRESFVVFQLDDAGYTSAEYTDASGSRVREEPATTLDESELRELLHIGDRPAIATKVIEGENVAEPMRALLALIVPAAARGELRERALPAAIELL